MSIRKIIRYITLISFILLACNIVIASTSTGSLPISTLVTANCSVGSTSINFGSYDPVGANATAPIRSSTSFQIACTKGANVRITLNNGLNGGNASPTTRAMSDGNSHYLSYELYSDAGYSVIWNISNPVTYIPTSSVGLSKTVYAQIPAGQNPYAGQYSDTVLITATF